MTVQLHRYISHTEIENLTLGLNEETLRGGGDSGEKLYL